MLYLGFLGGSVVKNPPATQETQVPSLGQEDPLEKGMATHSSILAWRIPWTEEPGGVAVYGVAKIQTRQSMHAYMLYLAIGLFLFLLFLFVIFLFFRSKNSSFFQF